MNKELLRKMAGRGTDNAKVAIKQVQKKEADDREREMEWERKESEYYDDLYDRYRGDDD